MDDKSTIYYYTKIDDMGPLINKRSTMMWLPQVADVLAKLKVEFYNVKNKLIPVNESINHGHHLTVQDIIG